ncbi:hypothetical protein SeLEV6574_g03815 [Synchytrium endobioticum]|nr:hypothetical protein SeLEV6574_g03815 [Synchytrium endobioticum]
MGSSIDANPGVLRANAIPSGIASQLQTEEGVEFIGLAVTHYAKITFSQISQVGVRATESDTVDPHDGGGRNVSR